ncbi:hypothetical protein EVA_06678 [gut metagenome]|uniref:Uncharacterized protein n=1 Tax=gut metagenome TaxID=749906 RepID=J9GX05_9ZZZZ
MFSLCLRIRPSVCLDYFQQPPSPLFPSLSLTFYGFRFCRPKCWDDLLWLPCGSSPVLG